MFLLRLNPHGTFLLSNAVAALFDMADTADVDVSPAEVIFSLSGNTPTGDVDRALLRIPFSIDGRVSLLNFESAHGTLSFSVNLRDLHANLSHGGADDWVSLHGEDYDPYIDVATINSETEEMFLSVLDKTEVHAERIIPPELDYQYQAIIVIPAEAFRHLITHLQPYGNSVSVHATDVEVRFSTLNEDVVYSTEFEECVIAGVHPGHPVTWSFSLHFLTVILNACLLPDSVWLLQSDDVPPMLNFPVGSMGNLMLYLH